MMMNNDILSFVASAQVSHNLNNVALIDKSKNLQYCKRNILLSKIIFWDQVFKSIATALLTGKKLEMFDANQISQDFLMSNNNLACDKFVDFFFNFHQPITNAYLRKIERELSNGMPFDKKFQYLADEIGNLLNLSYVELEGLDISCASFGVEPSCPQYKATGESECSDPSNVFFVMMNNEYKMEQGLFEKILSIAMNYLKEAKEEIIMIVDYRNMEQTDYCFGKSGRARYEYCMQYVKQIYFYHWKGGLRFGKEFNGLEKFLIPDKTALKELIKLWKNEKKLLTFDVKPEDICRC